MDDIETRFKNYGAEIKEKDLRARIEEEFEKYAKDSYEEMRRQFERLSESGWGSIEEGEKIIAQRKEKYDRFDFGRRVSELTNNFYLWCPGGNYRIRMEEVRDKKLKDEDKIASDERLISDIDRAISELGYDKAAIDLIQKKNTEGEEEIARAKAVAGIFLKMLSMEYGRDRLRT